MFAWVDNSEFVLVTFFLCEPLASRMTTLCVYGYLFLSAFSLFYCSPLFVLSQVTFCALGNSKLKHVIVFLALIQLHDLYPTWLQKLVPSVNRE